MKAAGRRAGVALAFVALIIAADLASKAWIFDWLGEREAVLPRDLHGHPRWPLAGEWLALMRNLNYGMAFGQGEDLPWVLVGGRIVAAFLLAWLIVRAPLEARLYRISLVLILGGALGNLWDNLARPIPPAGGRPFGPVRDFIDVYFPFWDWHFPTFNVADSCITVGAVFLLLSGFGARARQTAEGPEAGAAPDPGGTRDLQGASEPSPE